MRCTATHGDLTCCRLRDHDGPHGAFVDGADVQWLDGRLCVPARTPRTNDPYKEGARL